MESRRLVNLSLKYIDMTLLKIISVIFVSVVFTRCSTTGQRDICLSKPDNLNGRWIITEVAGRIIKPETNSENTPPFMVFDLSSKHLNGFSGCNSFSGKFEVSNDTIMILPLTATQRGCPGDAESILFHQLERIKLYNATADSLKFLSGDRVLLSCVRDNK